MNTPTTFSITRGGRVRYTFYAILLGGGSFFITSAFFTEGAKAHKQGWPVYIFAGLVITLWLGYAIYCGLRAFKSKSRVIVDGSGFSYEGVFKSSRFEWKDITKLRRVISNKWHDEWLEVTTKGISDKTHRVRLDFSGLSPDRNAFIGLARSLAPWIEEKW